MEWLMVAMAAFILVQQFELAKMNKRLVECENSKAAVDVLVDDVTELKDDFYGPSAK